MGFKVGEWSLDSDVFFSVYPTYTSALYFQKVSLSLSLSFCDLTFVFPYATENLIQIAVIYIQGTVFVFF